MSNTYPCLFVHSAMAFPPFGSATHGVANGAAAGMLPGYAVSRPSYPVMMSEAFPPGVPYGAGEYLQRTAIGEWWRSPAHVFISHAHLTSSPLTKSQAVLITRRTAKFECHVPFAPSQEPGNVCKVGGDYLQSLTKLLTQFITYITYIYFLLRLVTFHAMP